MQELSLLFREFKEKQFKAFEDKFGKLSPMSSHFALIAMSATGTFKNLDKTLKEILSQQQSAPALEWYKTLLLKSAKFLTAIGLTNFSEDEVKEIDEKLKLLKENKIDSNKTTSSSLALKTWGEMRSFLDEEYDSALDIVVNELNKTDWGDEYEVSADSNNYRRYVMLRAKDGKKTLTIHKRKDSDTLHIEPGEVKYIYNPSTNYLGPYWMYTLVSSDKPLLIKEIKELTGEDVQKTVNSYFGLSKSSSSLQPKTLEKTAGHNAIMMKSRKSSSGITSGGINLDPTGLNVGAASSALGFGNVSFETIQQIQSLSGITFKVLGMKHGVKLQSIVGAKENELSYLP